MENKRIDDLDLHIEFSAVYDPKNLQVTQISQTRFLQENSNLIPIDFDLAMKVIQGDIPMIRCFANLDTFTVEVVEEKSLNLIEDILHRIPEIQYSKYDQYDVIVTIDKNQIKFDLCSELGGMYDQSSIKKKVLWKDNIQLHFMLTDYNDPHIIYNIFEFSLFEMLGKSKIFSDVNLPKKFSIFTDRIFRSYVIKNENN